MSGKLYVSKFVDDHGDEYWVRDAEAIHPELTLKQWQTAVDVLDATEPIDVYMGSSYSYHSTDVVGVYLNGLKLTASEYSVTGTDSTINVALTVTTFIGQMEVVVGRLVEEE